jgi:hypothetical protein
MSVAIIEVPSRSRMANGLSKCLTAGIEYEMLENMKVEITCADDLKLAKVIAAFGGKIISASLTKEVTPGKPRQDVIYPTVNTKRRK